MKIVPSGGQTKRVGSGLQRCALNWPTEIAVAHADACEQAWLGHSGHHRSETGGPASSPAVSRRRCGLPCVGPAAALVNSTLSCRRDIAPGRRSSDPMGDYLDTHLKALPSNKADGISEKGVSAPDQAIVWLSAAASTTRPTQGTLFKQMRVTTACRPFEWS
jgi:hypothetical protein